MPSFYFSRPYLRAAGLGLGLAGTGLLAFVANADDDRPPDCQTVARQFSGEYEPDQNADPRFAPPDGDDDRPRRPPPPPGDDDGPPTKGRFQQPGPPEDKEGPLARDGRPLWKGDDRSAPAFGPPPPPFGPPPFGPPHPVMVALDRDRDGKLSAEEIRRAPKALRSLDRDGDGTLTERELHPPRFRDRGPPPARDPAARKGAPDTKPARKGLARKPAFRPGGPPPPRNDDPD